jgi:hypothetical protein
VALGIKDIRHYAQCNYAERRILFIVMLKVIILSAVELNVAMLSVEAPFRISYVHSYTMGATILNITTIKSDIQENVTQHNGRILLCCVIYADFRIR